MEDRTSSFPPMRVAAAVHHSMDQLLGGGEQHPNTTDEPPGVTETDPSGEHEEVGEEGQEGISSSPAAMEKADGADSTEKKQTDSQAPPQEPESAIKFLVANYLAGSLIGKKGATIKDIQVKTACMVRIATSGMYFPGTMERAVLIAGSTEGVKRACALILNTIHAPDHNISGCAKLLSDDLAANVEVTQRMLIPLTAGGLVIGRKGANIAALLEASGAKMTLGQKAEIKANERLVTVQGRLPEAVKAVEMLLDKLREEPVLSRFSNMSVSYRGHGSSKTVATSAAGITPTTMPFQTATRDDDSPTLAPAAGTDSPIGDQLAGGGEGRGSSVSPTKSSTSAAASPPRIASPSSAVSGAPGAQPGGRGLMGAGGGGRFQQHAYRSTVRQQLQQQYARQSQPIQHFNVQQQQRQHLPIMSSPSRAPPSQQQGVHAGGSLSPLQPPVMQMSPAVPMVARADQVGPMASMGLLSNSPNMPGMRMGYGSAPASAAVYHPGGLQQQPNVPAALGRGSGTGGEGQPRGYPPMPMMIPQQMVLPLETPIMTNPIAAAVASCQPTTTISVGVPNSMIGAILGRGGTTIAELQSMSGARINVSQRDDFMPGTENRVLTISGTAMATQTAQYLVSQKIQEIADRRRATQSS